ncbi:hypothetical protein [Halomonas sp. BC04]|uniref:hypothetical protein n=1 Tax=Halomonas sp. BC04 TaxID=1403540 RepID=UPI0018CC369F|nr:hypothetical protein [Halomonas sp. BC04]
MQSDIDALVLLSGNRQAKQFVEFTGLADTASAVNSLAEAIMANPCWDALSNPCLVARVDPDLILGVFGNFSSSDRNRLVLLSNQVTAVLRAHRYFSYHSAEKVAQRLADLLVERYGAEAISRFHFTAIPRGGLIVLGMLSYLLGLRPNQVEVSHKITMPKNGTLVIVDDCALTGVRFQQFLRRVDADHIIFCPMMAVPELRFAIERHEPGWMWSLSPKSLEIQALIAWANIMTSGARNIGSYQVIMAIASGSPSLLPSPGVSRRRDIGIQYPSGSRQAGISGRPIYVLVDA